MIPKFKIGDMIYSDSSKNTIQIIGINRKKKVYTYKAINGPIVNNKYLRSGNQAETTWSHVDNNFRPISKLEKVLA